SEMSASSDKGGVLIVFYSKDIEQTQAAIEAAGGSINKPVFPFPGGRRFHFTEPGGSEFAVWSDVDV
ncbi:MAG: VOC family protein, partial [Mariprofundaceae bacterium]|nr:VOC family protein [Mariprofundaceae bacterium]